MNRWFMRLSKKARVALIVATLFVIVSIIGVLTTSGEQSMAVTDDSMAQPTRKDPSKLSQKQTLHETRTEIETNEEDVPFVTSTTYDGTLPKDTTLTRVEGTKGKKVIRTEVKYRNGVEISRLLISENITVPAVTKVVAIGTKVVKSQKKTVTEPVSVAENCKENDGELSAVAAEAVCENDADNPDADMDQ